MGIDDCVAYMMSYVRSNDDMSETGSKYLHFEGDSKQQTLIGGLARIGISGIVMWIAITKGQQMLELKDPTV